MIVTFKAKISDNIGEIKQFVLPVLVEQTAISFMSVISSIMASNISVAAVSGVNLVDTLNVLIQQIFISLEIGATVVVAQYCGKGEPRKASEASIQAMSTSVVLALVTCTIMLIFPHQVLGIIFAGADPAVYSCGFTYFHYAIFSFPFLAIYTITTASIRGSGNPRLSLVAVVITNVLFAVFGFLFVYGFHMGVEGVGLALIFSRLVGAATGILLLKKGNSVLVIESWIPKKIQWNIQKAIMFIGIPACIENMIFMVGRLTTQTFVVHMGTESMAANAVSNSIAGFFNIPGNTASATAIPLVGKYLGMRNKQKAKDISKVILILAIAVNCILAVIMTVLAHPIAEIFVNDPGIQNQIAFITSTNYVASAVLWILSFVTPSVLRASGDVKYTTTVAILSMFVFRLTSGYLLGVILHLGVVGIWCGMYIDWAVRALLFTVRYAKGKWAERVLIKD